ncbi:tetratricopeptide repeat protein [Streptomyces jeddahensis]|uniref:Regulatory protein AfsR n=1 Tax=Streptomyces jeddahensis TaxID=1716141 RepID=A0A177HKM9_9ACTN|nr:tetratricopeptide repeat protein [Streptomyces jeddahensis]OAH11435.1 regulatory protein AfsR [Streptomyces jeddahensis]
MADQAVDTDGAEVPGEGRQPAAGSAPAESPVHPPEAPKASQFLGRTRELKELRADIERAGLDTLAGRKAPRARVLLIAGKPGSGRTALAEELVRQVAGRYPDGVLRARLTEPGGTPVPTERTARALLDALDLPAPPGAAEDDLTEALRGAFAGRRFLLLLDDAADAEQVDALLPDNPDCLVVAVSGGPLTGIPDVRPCTLGGLDTKSAVELLGRFTGEVRITCDPHSAETLVEQCGGQPAALLLAGGWLAARPKASVADLAKWLCGETDEGPALERVFRHAYVALPSVAARTLRLLSLAPAGLVDPHTASALAGCSVSTAQARLDEFAALGLVRPGWSVPEASSMNPASPLPQYEVPGCLMPLLRELTESLDRSAEIQLARARMLERTVRLLQSCRATTEPDGSPARKKLAGMPRALRFPSPAAAAEWLQVRQPALLAAARLAVADGELDTLARRLMAALVRALVAHRGTEAAAPELYGIHGLVLDVAERRGLHREKAAALLNLADLDARTGRTQQALTRYRAALDAGRQANDPYATSRAMESVGGAYQELGDWHRAADWYGRALAQRLTNGERRDAARLYGRLGTVHTYAGRYGEALRNWRSAVAAYRRAGDVPALARALSEMARVQEYAGRPEESLRTCQEAVERARHARDLRLQGALQLRLADTLERLGDPAAARLHRGAAERLLGPEAKGSAREQRADEQGGSAGTQAGADGPVRATGSAGADGPARVDASGGADGAASATGSARADGLAGVDGPAPTGGDVSAGADGRAEGEAATAAAGGEAATAPAGGDASAGAEEAQGAGQEACRTTG